MALVKTFLADENAAEITELGIVLAAIVAGCIVAIVAMGPKIIKGWNDANTEVQKL